MKNLCSPVYTEQVQRVAVGINVLLLTAGVDFFCQVGDRGRVPVSFWVGNGGTGMAGRSFSERLDGLFALERMGNRVVARR